MCEIYAYGNVDTLTGVFNAIAAIMGGAETMDFNPRLLTGDPSAFAGGGRNSAVERGREFQRDGWPRGHGAAYCLASVSSICASMNPVTVA